MKKTGRNYFNCFSNQESNSAKMKIAGLKQMAKGADQKIPVLKFADLKPYPIPLTLTFQHMKIEHLEVWTQQLETLKAFYMQFFNASANEKYHNPRLK